MICNSGIVNAGWGSEDMQGILADIISKKEVLFENHFTQAVISCFD